MKNNCFENTNHSNLDLCHNVDTGGGLTATMYYIPSEWVYKMLLPAIGGDFSECMTIPRNNIVFKEGRSAKTLKVLLDENELKTILVGSNKSKLKPKTELNVFMPGFKASTLGFIDTYKNIGMVCFVADTQGNIWVVGNRNTPAFFENADVSTGKKYEDNAGGALKITANCPLYKYEGPVELSPLFRVLLFAPPLE